ncbi:caspase family protein [Bacillus sp. H1m]|uniref:caspase family protein n=1 Tax=Bacillus sp. H1m TaxID=1397277 RepID=UPI00046AC82D|nr:caspase family protein [Bacillus sp. H1m]
MGRANQSNIFAVIVAIEEYHFDISNVKYAQKDASTFNDFLTNELNVPSENIKLWLGNKALKTALQEELPYIIRQLNTDDLFIFYYAGHGFCDRGYNRLTAWDTHPFNLSETTILLKDVLLEPLQNSACKKSLVFIDACATNLIEQGIARDLLSQMNNKEFGDFIRSGDYQATFLSCSPGEKSYSSDVLKHGIWTYHLINALKGNAPDAIVRDRYITSTSLQHYLRIAIPEYILRKTDIKSQQTPWAQISSSNIFEIRELAQKDSNWNTTLMDIELKVEQRFFRNIETSSISRLPGFSRSRGHFIPNTHSDRVTDFIQSLLSEQLSGELTTIYERSKEVLGLKRKQIQKEDDNGSFTIDTPFYRYYLDSFQNPDDYSEYIISRKLVLLVDPLDLPEGFDYIFPIKLNEIIIPILGKIEFDTLVEKFEDLADSIGGDVEEDDTKGLITYLSADRTKFVFMLDNEELCIKPRQTYDLFQMLEQASSSLISITSSVPKAIEE